MTKEAKKVFDKFFKIHRDNVAGKTKCKKNWKRNISVSAEIGR